MTTTVSVDTFFKYPWTEETREALRGWMSDNGIHPARTLAITIGEGHVAAEQIGEPQFIDSELNIVTATYSVATLPPVWPR